MLLRPWFALALVGCATVDTYTLPDWITPVPAPVCAADPAVQSSCAPGVAATAAGVDYGSLAEALAAAPAGATVSVCPGEHAGPFEVVGRELRAYDPAPGATILSGAAAPGTVVVAEDATLWGLTVQGASEVDPYDSGALIGRGEDPVAVVCGTFRDNAAVAVYSEAPLRVHGSVVSGGPLSGFDGVYSLAGLDLQHSALRANNSGVHGGGGAFVADSVLEAESEELSGTLLQAWGGDEVVVLRSTFRDNPHGEGLMIAAPRHVYVEDSTFERLSGGIVVWVTPELRSTLLRSSFVDSGVGFAVAETVDGDVVTDLWHSRDPQPLLILGEDLTFLGNDAGEFGAVALTEHAVFDCDGCTFVDNAPCDFFRGGACEDLPPAFFW